MLIIKYLIVLLELLYLVVLVELFVIKIIIIMFKQLCKNLINSLGINTLTTHD